MSHRRACCCAGSGSGCTCEPDCLDNCWEISITGLQFRFLDLLTCEWVSENAWMDQSQYGTTTSYAFGYVLNESVDLNFKTLAGTCIGSSNGWGSCDNTYQTVARIDHYEDYEYDEETEIYSGVDYLGSDYLKLSATVEYDCDSNTWGISVIIETVDGAVYGGLYGGAAYALSGTIDCDDLDGVSVDNMYEVEGDLPSGTLLCGSNRLIGFGGAATATLTTSCDTECGDRCYWVSDYVLSRHEEGSPPEWVYQWLPTGDLNGVHEWPEIPPDDEEAWIDVNGDGCRMMWIIDKGEVTESCATGYSPNGAPDLPANPEDCF